MGNCPSCVLLSRSDELGLYFVALLLLRLRNNALLCIPLLFLSVALSTMLLSWGLQGEHTEVALSREKTTDVHQWSSMVHNSNKYSFTMLFPEQMALQNSLVYSPFWFWTYPVDFGAEWETQYIVSNWQQSCSGVVASLLNVVLIALCFTKHEGETNKQNPNDNYYVTVVGSPACALMQGQ